MIRCRAEIEEFEFIGSYRVSTIRLCDNYIFEGEELCDFHLLQKYNLASAPDYSGLEAGMVEPLYRERDVIKALRRAEFRK